MRTPSIDTLSAKIEKLENQVSKLEAKRTELSEAREKLATLSSGENRDAMRARLIKKRAEAERLSALLDSLEAEDAESGDAADAESVTINAEDVGTLTVD